MDYPSITDPDDKVTFVLEHHSMYVMHLVSFELVALALVVVTLGSSRLHEHAPATMQVACPVGLIRAGLLLASVMVFDHGMSVVVDAQATDPQQAAATWQVIEPVADALGGTGGDVLGGLWRLLISWVALRARTFPRPFNWLGLTTGAAALLSAVPALGILEVVVGLLMIVWFLWFGIAATWPASTPSPPEPSTATTTATAIGRSARPQ